LLEKNFSQPAVLPKACSRAIPNFYFAAAEEKFLKLHQPLPEM
jgi:hypothetical protein